MELRQLRAVIAVAEAGSFTLAADRLHVVQSAVSSAIRTLEAELGHDLFIRGPRGAELSDAGHALLPEARAVLDAVALSLDAVAQVTSGLRGEVVLGMMQAQEIGSISVPRLLETFAGGHPQVQVTMRHVGGSLEIAEGVRDGRLDLGFVALPDDQLPDLELAHLHSEPMAIVCHSGHELASFASVGLADVVGERFADLSPGWGSRMAGDRAFAGIGAKREISYEVNDTTTVVEFVRVGLALALLPPSIVKDTELVVVPIAAPAPTFDTFLASPTNRRSTAAARALVALVRTAAH